MEITWSEAPQSVIHTAEEIIRQYHPWLITARIAFVMRSESQKRGQRYVLGQASKVPDKMQPYFEFDFLIWLSEKDYEGMSDATREALIDHELEHCKPNMMTGGWRLIEHDIQEFATIILRRGLWTEDLRRMDKAKEAYQQGDLLKDTTVTMSDARGKVATMTGEQLARAAALTSDQIHKIVQGETVVEDKDIEAFRDELLEEAKKLRDEMEAV
jgi:hypothetical protein